MTLNKAVEGHPMLKVMVSIDSPGVVSYSTSVDPIVAGLSVTVLEIFDIKAIFPKEQWWKLIPLPVWRTCVFRIFTKTIGIHISWDFTLVASLVKIGGGLRPVERSTRFVWLTHWLTHRQDDFIICPMLLTHWADNNPESAKCETSDESSHCFTKHDSGTAVSV